MIGVIESLMGKHILIVQVVLEYIYWLKKQQRSRLKMLFTSYLVE